MLAALGVELLVALHMGFILLVMFGGVLVAWRGLFAWLHLPALAWGVWISVTHGICPLTPLENSLRHAAGEAGYPGGFIDHYLTPVIYPAGLTPSLQFAFAALLVTSNALLYGWALLRRRAEKRRKP